MCFTFRSPLNFEREALRREERSITGWWAENIAKFKNRLVRYEWAAPAADYN
jgi:hypothetical protein